MMKRIWALGFVSLCLLVSQASASDLDGVVFTDDANFARPAELGSGWYIRGDIGLNFNGVQDVSINGNPAAGLYQNNNYTDKIHFDAGVGYRFSNYLRVDAGIGRLAGTDYSSSQLMYEDPASANVADPLAVQPGEPNPCNGWGTFIDVPTGTTYTGDDFISNCVDKDKVEYDTTYIMANVYADLPKFYGFVPFVGAGVGIGRLAWREEINSIECTPSSADVRVEGCRAYGVGDQPAANTPYTQPGTVSEGVDYRLGIAFTAGLGYNINENLTLEMAYRYMNFGATLLSQNGSTGSGLASSGYGTHQVNLGLRYAIW
jgi:opacity protein-like surface antigen